jgi:hypothetical protein
MKLRCGSCRWWDNYHESIKLVPFVPGKDKIGFCRKHKPMFINVSGYYYGVWGVCDSEEFCGEFSELKEI